MSLFTLVGRLLLRFLIRTKYLGIYIDQFLTWQKHTEYILQRIRGKVHCLNRLRPLSGSILFRLYCGFILPIFDYCDTVWSPPTALLSKSMERIHARFVGHMSGALSFVKATLIWQSVVTFIQLFRFTKLYIFLYLYLPSGYVYVFRYFNWTCW